MFHNCREVTADNTMPAMIAYRQDILSVCCMLMQQLAWATISSAVSSGHIPCTLCIAIDGV